VGTNRKDRRPSSSCAVFLSKRAVHCSSASFSAASVGPKSASAHEPAPRRYPRSQLVSCCCSAAHGASRPLRAIALERRVHSPRLARRHAHPLGGLLLGQRALEHAPDNLQPINFFADMMSKASTKAVRLNARKNQWCTGTGLFSFAGNVGTESRPPRPSGSRAGRFGYASRRLSRLRAAT
jgi:hypothetical protein